MATIIQACLFALTTGIAFHVPSGITIGSSVLYGCLFLISIIRDN